ncbi:MAG: hypothetical protein AB1938_18655 [Myxococcota bacterium]
MAPRPPETLEQFLARLREAAKAGHSQVRFGLHHFSHAVLREGDVWRVRRLVLEQEKADAYRKKHGKFMREDAEMLSEPGGPVLLEAASVDALVEAFRARQWPW